MNNNNIHAQKGVAIIGVLIIVALITAAYSFLLSKQSEVFEGTKLSIQQTKAFNYFYSIQSLAKSAISKYNEEKDMFGEAYQRLYNTPYRFSTVDGYLTGTLSDRGAKLNINQILTIKDNNAKLRADSNFGNCLFKLTNDLEIERIDDFIIEYINNKESKTPFLHISELKNVDGITAEYYQKLKPFLYADNLDSKININQASKDILMCLHNDIDGYIADNIISNRPLTSLTSVQNLLVAQLPNLSTNEIKNEIVSMLSVRSSYFELQSEIIVGETKFKATSILVDKGGKIDSYFREFDHAL